MANKKIIIIGGGVIGLGIGWQLAKAGAAVTIYERSQAGRAASWAAAGMLAPLAEAHTEEPELLKLGSQSLARYPQWVDELETDAEMSIGYRVEGTLIVGLEPDDTHQLRHLYTAQQDLGLNVEWLTGRDAREIESVLSPRVTAAIRCATDYQVDNRLMVQALQRAYQVCGGVLHENSTIEKNCHRKRSRSRRSNTRRFSNSRRAHSCSRMLVCTDRRVNRHHHPPCASCKRTDVGTANGSRYYGQKRHPHCQGKIFNLGISGTENRWQAHRRSDE